MKTSKQFTVLLLLVFFFKTTLWAQLPGSGWSLKWSDNFDGTSVDESKWKIDDNLTRSADNNKTCYERENVSVTGGILKLKVDNSGCDCSGTVYSGGMISSTGNYYNNKYGYIEARIRYNFTGPGFWGNFWTNSTEGWPPEFDMAEFIANEKTKITMAYHYNDVNNVHKSSGARPECDWNNWHTYGIEWLEGQPLRFYIDGVKVFEPTSSITYPPNEKMYVILRMGAFNSSTWGGIPDATSVWPGYAEYDWVKVWEKTGVVNNPPSVSLTAPVNHSSYSAPASLTITANASDADGSVTKVEFYNGGTKLGEDTSSPYSLTWSDINAGTYTLTAKAYDNSGNSKSTSSVTITVIDNSTDNVIWLESFSDLSDGTKIDNGTTAWTTSRDSGVFEVVSNEFSISNPGGIGIWTSEAIQISNYSSVDVSIDLQGTGSLDASGEFLDYIKVYYVLNGGSETLLTSKDGSFGNENWNNYKKTGLSGTSLKIVVKALISGGGEFYYWDNIKVTTKDAINNAPIVSITSPQNNSSYTAPASVDITASASDSDGTIAKVEFYNGTTKIGDDNTSPFSLVWKNVQAGTYAIVAKATDNSGKTGMSSVVKVSVESAVSSSAIWFEQFSGIADSTKIDNGSTKWTSTRSSGVFEVIDEEFSITDAGGEGVWTSESINISTYDSVDISIDLQGMGLLDASGPNLDYLKVYFQINNGTEISLLSQNGGFNDETWHTYSKKGLSGNSIKIIVKGLVTGGGEYYLWDNIKVSSSLKSNIRPLVVITTPESGNTFNALSSLTISANASDMDGSIAKVEFYNGTSKLGEDVTSPYAYVWSNLTEGVYSITAKAYDNNGESTVSQTVAITVNKATSTNDVSGEIKVFPTLTTGILYVREAQGFHYSIVNLTGLLISSGTIENGELHLEDLPCGMYFIQIQNQHEMISKRFVKE